MAFAKSVTKSVDSELLQMDFTATRLSGHYSEDELRQLESELEFSQIVQRALLPHMSPPCQATILRPSAVRPRSSPATISTSCNSKMARMAL